MRLLEATSGEVRFDGQDITHLKGARLKAVRRDMQMIFQDPYSSLNPRKTIGSIIGRAVRDPRPGAGQGRAQARRAGADGDGRPEPRALQPLPARVLRRAAPADRRRARAGAETEAADRRRAGLGARRLDPGAGAEPAARHAAPARADARVHRPRPVGRAAHVRPRGGHVSRPDRRDRARATRCTTFPRHPYTGALLSAVPVADPTARKAASARCSAATCRARPTRRAPAASTRAARRRRSAARSRIRRWRTRAPARARPATSR